MKVVELNDKVQSVYHRMLRNWHTVFFSANISVSMKHLKLQATRPCIVMIIDNGTEYKVSVADSSRSQQMIK